MHKTHKAKMRWFKCKLGLHRHTHHEFYNCLMCKDCKMIMAEDGIWRKLK